MNRRNILGLGLSAPAVFALAEMRLAHAASGKCNHDHQCPEGQICISNTCGVAPDPNVVTVPVEVIRGTTCRDGEAPLRCCLRVVKRACANKGSRCRKRGKKRCKHQFGS